MLTAEMRKTIEEIGWGEKWRQEGRMEERLGNARALFAEGDSIEKIARITRIHVDMLKEKLLIGTEA